MQEWRRVEKLPCVLRPKRGSLFMVQVVGSGFADGGSRNRLSLAHACKRYTGLRRREIRRRLVKEVWREPYAMAGFSEVRPVLIPFQVLRTGPEVAAVVAAAAGGGGRAGTTRSLTPPRPRRESRASENSRCKAVVWKSDQTPQAVISLEAHR